MNTKDLLPALSPERSEALKRSIQEQGVLNPILVDQHGEVIDGIARKHFCDELSISCPQIVQSFESDAERLLTRIELNLARRQLTGSQKRQVIGAYLVRDAEIANNHLGEILGVSENTVKKVRNQLESTSQIATLTRLRGRDGKVRRKHQRILANSPAEFKRAAALIEQTPESSRILSVSAASKVVRMSVPKAALPTASVAVPDRTSMIQLLHCPFQKLPETALISPGSVSLILTDPPYERAWLTQWDALSEFAAEFLHDGGLLVTHCGIHFLPEVLASLSRHLTYRWTIATLWKAAGNTQFVAGNSVLNKWLPILVLSKGQPDFATGFTDVVACDTHEKQLHKWQQPLAVFEKLVHAFSKPGDLVVDPCGGSFTTAVACQRLERRFIGCDSDPQCVTIGHERLRKQLASPDTSAATATSVWPLVSGVTSDQQPTTALCT